MLSLGPVRWAFHDLPVWLLLWLLMLAAPSYACDPRPLAAGQIDPACQATRLDGTWQGLAGLLIPPRQIDRYAAQAVPLEVPGYWTKAQLNSNDEHPGGYVTLWTELRLSGELATGEDLALWPGRHASAARIYVADGRGKLIKVFDNLSPLVAESAIPVSKLPAPGLAGRLFGSASAQLPKLYPGARIIIHIYAEDFRTSGIAQAPELGKTETLHQNILQRWFLHVLFLGASLVVTIYSLTRALLSSKLRTLHIFMVFMSIGAGLRLIITGNLLPYLAADLTVNHQFYWSWVTFLGLLGVFVGGQPVIVPKVFASRPNLKRLFILMAYLPLLLVCLIPLLSLHTFLLSGHLLRLVYISVAIVYTVFLAIEVWRRPRGQWLQLVGTIVILVAGVSDSVVYASNRDPYIEAFAMAMFFFIVSQAIYFGWGHIRLLDRTQNLSSDLRELNANLEGQVLQRTRDLEKVNARLELAATTDVLTGLPNRRAFELEIEKEMGRAQRNPEPLCLAIVDADWFKLVNDRYGHDFGDTVLQQLAHCLRDSLRKTDFVARIGGEEFAIVLPGADLQAAAGRLAKLCAGVKELSFSQQPSYRLSISIGCAQWQGPVPAAPSTGLEPQQLAGESIDSLYKRADTALYRAKKDGRGRLELAGSASYSSD